jgi:hypothetical protein
MPMASATAWAGTRHQPYNYDGISQTLAGAHGAMNSALMSSPDSPGLAPLSEASSRSEAAARFAAEAEGPLIKAGSAVARRPARLFRRACVKRRSRRTRALASTVGWRLTLHRSTTRSRVLAVVTRHWTTHRRLAAGAMRLRALATSRSIRLRGTRARGRHRGGTCSGWSHDRSFSGRVRRSRGAGLA